MRIKSPWITGQPTVGVEAIDYQGVSNLHKYLAETMGLLESISKPKQSDLDRLSIENEIKRLTGLNIKIHLYEEDEINMSVQVPVIDRSSPMYDNWMREFAPTTLIEMLPRIRGDRTTYIDRKNSTIHGFFSRIENNVYIPTGTLTTKMLTAEEKGAILLHELGHLYSYFETLIDMVKINVGIASATNRILEMKNDVLRVKYLNDWTKETGIELSDKSLIVTKDTDGNAIYTRLITDAYKTRRTEYGMEAYSARNFEYLADQFATRHGAGAHLGSGLYKMDLHFRHGGSERNRPTYVTNTFTNLLQTVGMIVAPIVGSVVLGAPWLLLVPVLVAAVAMLIDPVFLTYDPPLRRIERIREDCYESLKNRKLPKHLRDELTGQVQVLDEILGNLKEYKPFLDVVAEFLSPNVRKGIKAAELQQRMERLVNNRLFAISANFRK